MDYSSEWWLEARTLFSDESGHHPIKRVLSLSVYRWCSVQHSQTRCLSMQRCLSGIRYFVRSSAYVLHSIYSMSFSDSQHKAISVQEKHSDAKWMHSLKISRFSFDMLPTTKLASGLRIRTFLKCYLVQVTRFWYTQISLESANNDAPLRCQLCNLQNPSSLLRSRTNLSRIDHAKFLSKQLQKPQNRTRDITDNKNELDDSPAKWIHW